MHASKKDLTSGTTRQRIRLLSRPSSSFSPLGSSSQANERQKLMLARLTNVPLLHFVNLGISCQCQLLRVMAKRPKRTADRSILNRNAVHPPLLRCETLVWRP